MDAAQSKLNEQSHQDNVLLLNPTEVFKSMKIPHEWPALANEEVEKEDGPVKLESLNPIWMLLGERRSEIINYGLLIRWTLNLLFSSSKAPPLGSLPGRIRQILTAIST